MKFIIYFLGMVLLAACTPSSPPGLQATLKLEPCRVIGAARMGSCGTLDVAENPEEKDAATIPLRVVVFRSESRTVRSDPVFLLAGGPGQASTEAFLPLLPVLFKIAKDRDVVLVDQRGTGASAPLDCETDDDLSSLFEHRANLNSAKRCAAALKRDPRQFTSSIAAGDLDSVRRALAYEKINLLGVSYGTRLALIYARRYPTAVRSMIIDGVAPVDMPIPLYFARDGQRAFDLLLRDCANDAPCHRAFPRLRENFDALLGQLAESPKTVSVHHPRSGKKVSLVITRDVFAQAVRGLLYTPELSALLPFTISQALAGNFEPFVAQVELLTRGAQEAMSTGLFMSVICAEDVPFINDEQLVAASRGSFLGEVMVREFREACAFWTAGQVTEQHHEPVRGSWPVLALSGELDPVTPPSWAEHAIATLPNGRSVVVPGAGHGVMARPCVPKRLLRFLNKLDANSLDLSCVDDQKRTPFFIDFAGPPA